jgi:hypothetical protein
MRVRDCTGGVRVSQVGIESGGMMRAQLGAMMKLPVIDAASDFEPPFQPFPTNGVLRSNTDVPLGRLKSLPEASESARVYAYVLRSIVPDPSDPDRRVHRGSGPNFQGGAITLCTCKHSMRSAKDPDEWRSQWVAGIGRKLRGSQQYLFYLMRVERAFNSHSDLWNELPAAMRRAKSASVSRHGDVYEPSHWIARDDTAAALEPTSYRPPMHLHTHLGNRQWHSDIDSASRDRWGRNAALLLGDPRLSFLWTRPLLFPNAQIGQGHRNKWRTLAEFLSQMTEYGPDFEA